VSNNSFSSSLSLDEKVRISRLMLLICSSLCGAMLLVVMAASVYAYHNVEAKKISDGLQFWIIFVQFWLFLVPLVALIRPGWLRRKIDGYRGSQDQIKGSAIILLIWMFFAGLACYSTLSFYSSCLNGECNIDLLKTVRHRH
jgi:heme/copper-type cytochrome/quinol oxidase subunit 1